jgi:hypothetical protein
MSQNKTEEIGLAKLSLGSLTLAEQIEQHAKLAELLKTMRGVVSDHRMGNVHTQSGSVLPERPTPPTPVVKGTGWQDVQKLQPPDHVAACDRIADYFAAQEKAGKP